MTIPDLAPYGKHLLDPSGGISGMSTDIRHLAMMWRAVEQSHPDTIVEVGSYRGGSACLWLEALKHGYTKTVHLFEPSPTPQLLDLIRQDPLHIVLHRQSYFEFPLYADFIFVDGDHQWPAIADLFAAVVRKCDIIAMHDSMGFVSERYSDCWGSWLGANILRQADDYAILEDYAARPGTRCERGFLMARRVSP